MTYYYADEGDNFFPLTVEEGADLAPYREQYEDLFVEAIAYTWPSSKKETHSGTITIRGNAEYDDQVKNMDFTIHVRGNSTAGQDKKPYKIKLDKKTDLFGLGGGVKNKHWVLLANCFDESLMRNKLCYDLAGQFGAPVWMKSEWVDVVMNGKYVGNYQLCQHIRVSEERIPILNWDTGDVAEAAQKANPALTSDDVDALDVMLETNKQGEAVGVDYTMGKEEYLIRTDSLIIKNLKTNKVRQISQEIGKVPVLSFGNSSGDCAMHNYCLSNKQYRTAVFMLVADDDARDHASLAEAAKREAKWREAGYNIISMKNDFKTIYGPEVKKVDFVY